MKNILVVNPYGIGDVLFCTPLLQALKNQPGVERVDILLGSRTKELLENNPNVDEIHVMDKDVLHSYSPIKRFFKTLQFYKELKKFNYDCFIDLSLTREYAFFAKFILKIPVRVGFAYKKRGCYLTETKPLPNGFEGKSVPWYYAELLKLLSIAPPKKLEMEFGVTSFVLNKVETRLREQGILKGSRIVAVSAGGGASWGKDAHFKQWQPRFFRELLEKIQLMFPMDAVLFLGGRADDLLNHEVSKGLSIPAYLFADYLTLEETAACLKLSRFALLNEGGLCHLAATQKTPLVALVGPVDERVYAPVGDTLQLLIKRDDLECRPCYGKFRYKSDCEHRACLTELTPEMAYRHITQSYFLQQLEGLAPQLKAASPL